MKLPPAFVLTKGEQRIVVVILVALIATAWIKRARDPRFAPAPSTPAPEISSQPADGDEEDREPTEGED